MMKKSIAALIVLTSMYACRSNQKPGQAESSTTPAVSAIAATDSLKYTYDSVKVYAKVSAANQNKKVTDTAKAVAVYPVFNDQTVNKFFTDRVIGLAGKQDTYKNYKELTAGFIKEFDTYRAANPGTSESWFEDMNLKVIANYPDYLSVLYTYVDYKGGAHPNTLFTYFNYNPKTYQTITLDSLVSQENMPKLRTIAEKIFRKNEKLAANASLSEGYFFRDNVFALAETFTVTKEGIKFLYNPYEIKAYAAGTTELTVPFTEIKAILKPSSILVNFNK